MSGFYLDQTRAKLEELETVEKALVIKLAETLGIGDESITSTGELKKLPPRAKTHMSSLRSDHFLAVGLNEASVLSEKITETDTERLNSFIQNTSNGGIESFYKNLKDINERYLGGFHSVQAPSNAAEMSHQMGEKTEPIFLETSKRLLRQVESRIVFSGEEFYGRCLDLHRFYQQFINLFNTNSTDESERKLGSIQYIEYLDRMGLFSSLDYSKVKVKSSYENYLVQLFSYLKSFHERTQPLVELNYQSKKMEFLEKFQSGTFEGWESNFPSDSELLDLIKAKSSEEFIEAVKEDGIRKELIHRGLKIGGRLEDRIKRLKSSLEFAAKQPSNPTPTAESRTDGFELEEFLKFSSLVNENLYPGKAKASRSFSHRKLAFLEYIIQHLLSHLDEAIDKTKERVIKKSTQSYDEIKAEEQLLEKAEIEQALEEQEPVTTVMEEENADDTANNFNPRNLPIGFDGNPIPFWLYKMQGLNEEFSCEICGSVIFQGRQNFERHFQETRHSTGMKILGIPNTKHFHAITKIQDARNLFQKLQQKMQEEYVVEEEFETKDGRKVVQRKTIA